MSKAEGNGWGPDVDESLLLSDGHVLHVVDHGPAWEVWLNSLCLGHGRSRDEALRAAVAVLEEAAERLQGPSARLGAADCAGSSRRR